MAVLPIRLYGDPILREKCKSVDGIDKGVQELAQNLKDTVDAAEGLGLAAPQIGIPLRVIVVVEVDQERRKHHIVINPEIVSMCGEQVGEEGCLSIPGIYEKVKRPQGVVVRGVDEGGREVTIEAAGIIARAFAHEIDHLDGVLFIDRIGFVRRSLLRGKLSAIKKKAKEMLRSPR